MRIKCIVIFFAMVFLFSYTVAMNKESEKDKNQAIRIYDFEKSTRKKQIPNNKRLEVNNKSSAAIPKISLTDADRPMVTSIDTAIAWWDQPVTITGSNFSRINEQNMGHFFPLWDNTFTTNYEGTQVEVNIPEGARSSYPLISSAGIGGFTGNEYQSYSGPWLDIVATASPIDVNFPDIRSVVEGRNTHLIYVGYENNGAPTIVAVALYQSTPIVKRIVDSGSSIPGTTWLRPYLSRIDKNISIQEICYVKNDADKTQGGYPDIYCVKDCNPDDGPCPAPERRAHVHNGDTQVQLEVLGVDATEDGMHYFVADGNSHHVIYVGRYLPINWNFGNAPDWSFFSPKTGLAASMHLGSPNADISVANGSSGTDFFTLTASGYAYQGSDYDSYYYDIEIDRRISSSSLKYIYCIRDHSYGALAEDTAHDIRGFVQAYDLDQDSLFDHLQLKQNTTSTIRLNDDWLPPSAPLTPIANQYEIVISDEPVELQALPYPKPLEQIAPSIVQITARGWRNRDYYVRVVDPSDLAGYAVPVATTNTDCVAYAPPPQTGGGPYMNACDNKVWDNNTQVSQFGLCLDYQNCQSPVKMLTIHTPDSGYESVTETTFYLIMPRWYAGDNVIVQLSEMPFANANTKQPVDGFSGVYTSWKRVALESDFMFRHGGLLYSDHIPWSTCTPPMDCNTIEVYDWSDVQVNDLIWVFTEPPQEYPLQPQPNRPPIPPPCDVPGFLPDSNWECATVTNIAMLADGIKVVTLDRQLYGTYYASQPDNNYQPDFINRHSAGFGVHAREILPPTNPPTWEIYDCHRELGTISTSCFYDADTSKLSKIFNDAYTFVEVSPNVTYGSGAVPYLGPDFFKAYIVPDGQACNFSMFDPEENIDSFYRFAWIWFNKKDSANYLQGALNYFHLLAIGSTHQKHSLDESVKCYACDMTQQYCDIPNPPADCFPYCNYWAASKGIGANIYASSIIFPQECLEFMDLNHAQCRTEEQMEQIYQNAVNHEVAHVFRINPNIVSGHDSRCQWIYQEKGCPDPDEPQVCPLAVDFGCLMHANRPPYYGTDNVPNILLCTRDLFCGSPDCPDSEGTLANCCDTATSECDEPGNGSIRQVKDPKKIHSQYEIDLR